MRTAPMTREARLAPISTRRVNTHSGRIGSAALRSTRTNATSSTTEATTIPIPAGESQPHEWPPSSSARMSSETPVVSRIAPAQSMAWRTRSIRSWNPRTSSTVARAPIGRLTKKIQRHETYSENTPPRVGPTIEAMPQTLAMKPCTRARSSTE